MVSPIGFAELGTESIRNGYEFGKKNFFIVIIGNLTKSIDLGCHTSSFSHPAFDPFEGCPWMVLKLPTVMGIPYWQTKIFSVSSSLSIRLHASLTYRQ